MNKGFSLLELIIVIALSLILSSIGVFKVNKSTERNAVVKMKNQIPTFLTNQMNKAYETGYIYTVKYNEKKRRLETYQGKNLIEKLELEKPLEYEIAPVNNKIDSQGAYESDMDINIFDSHHDLLFNVHIDVIEAVHACKVCVN